MITVKKRDGSYVAYRIKKIQDAMQKAFLSTGTPVSDDVLELLALRATADAGKQAKEDILEVEVIQDSVERILSNCGYPDVAKAYILYRQQHEKLRRVNDTLLDYKKLVDDYLKINDWRVKENSTVT